MTRDCTHEAASESESDSESEGHVSCGGLAVLDVGDFDVRLLAMPNVGDFDMRLLAMFDAGDLSERLLLLSFRTNVRSASTSLHPRWATAKTFKQLHATHTHTHIHIRIFTT